MAHELSFEKAVQSAKDAHLTDINFAKDGVPFYSRKTLDPNWEENGKTPIVKIDDLKLIDQNGKSIAESAFDGRVTFVAFFFSSCAGFCPTFLKNLQAVEKKLTDKHKNVQFIAISVDPETDTPKALKRYSERMALSKNWILLTGNKEKIYSLARNTLASETFELPKSKGQFAHSEHFFVIDEKRRLRGILKGTRLDVADRAVELMSALKKVL